MKTGGLIILARTNWCSYFDGEATWNKASLPLKLFLWDIWGIGLGLLNIPRQCKEAWRRWECREIG